MKIGQLLNFGIKRGYIDKNVVEFTPDSDKETKQLEELWRVIVDCARFSRRMVPIGEYLPAQKNMARFAIEGEKVSESVFPIA